MIGVDLLCLGAVEAGAVDSDPENSGFLLCDVLSSLNTESAGMGERAIFFF